jgi:hypothetical protein
MNPRLSPELIKQIKELRKTNHLHTWVEKRLIQIMQVIAKDYHPIPEPQGLAGGRNDLMLFEFSGRKILFEVLATASQVSRDLRILDKTKADIKIAVIIDKEIDTKVFEKVHKENPENNYPFLFIGELFEESLLSGCVLKLQEIIFADENATFFRILQQKLSTNNFIDICKREGINILSQEDINSNNITIPKVFVTLVLHKCKVLGIQTSHLKTLGVWLSDEKLIEFVLMKIQLGFNLFLYTDLNEIRCIYSDIELQDWLRIGHQLSKPYVLLPINTIIYEIYDKYFQLNSEFELNREIKMTIAHSLLIKRSQVTENGEGNSVIFSLPNKTKEIKILRPIDEVSKDQAANDYLNMVEIV